MLAISSFQIYWQRVKRVEMVASSLQWLVVDCGLVIVGLLLFFYVPESFVSIHFACLVLRVLSEHAMHCWAFKRIHVVWFYHVTGRVIFRLYDFGLDFSSLVLSIFIVVKPDSPQLLGENFGFNVRRNLIFFGVGFIALVVKIRPVDMLRFVEISLQVLVVFGFSSVEVVIDFEVRGSGFLRALVENSNLLSLQVHSSTPNRVALLAFWSQLFIGRYRWTVQVPQIVFAHCSIGCSTFERVDLCLLGLDFGRVKVLRGFDIFEDVSLGLNSSMKLVDTFPHLALVFNVKHCTHLALHVVRNLIGLFRGLLTLSKISTTILNTFPYIVPDTN